MLNDMIGNDLRDYCDNSFKFEIQIVEKFYLQLAYIPH